MESSVLLPGIAAFTMFDLVVGFLQLEKAALWFEVDL